MTTLALKELQRQVAFKAINIDYLISLSEVGDDGSDLVIDLIYIYLESAPLEVAKTIACLRAHDLRGFQQSVARLEFGSERIGARTLADICRLARAEIETSEPELISDQLIAMEQELELVEHELSMVSNLLSSFSR